jgi:hypothetical protein
VLEPIRWISLGRNLRKKLFLRCQIHKTVLFFVKLQELYKIDICSQFY